MSIETWADAYGVWHASVPLCDRAELSERGAQSIEASKAREAIITALHEREATWSDPSDPHMWRGARTVHVTRERVTNHGTVVYKEVG